MPHSENTGWQTFVHLLDELGTDQDINRCMKLLLTHEEQYDMGKRILIIKHLLANDCTQRELAKKLNVSIAKITRGSNALKTIDPGLRSLLLKMLE